MDLNQRKLVKEEWDSIEIPVSESERKILSMIIQGYEDVNIRINTTRTISSFLSAPSTPGMDQFIFLRFFQLRITKKTTRTIGKISLEPTVILI